MANYIIGDTIQLKATIKNFVGAEDAPGTITVEVQKLDGTVLLSSTGTAPALVSTGVTAQYYKDWTISTGLTEDTRLAAIWKWSGPHKKKILFNVIPIM